MVFIRTPETYFALEQLRDATFSIYVSKIQRAWHKWSGRRHMRDLHAAMAKLYAAHQKGRQRVYLHTVDNESRSISLYIYICRYIDECTYDVHIGDL